MARSRKSARVPPSMHPHAAVILALDPGARTGWAIFVDGRLVASGAVLVQRHERVSAVIADAKRRAADAGRPLVVVAEEWGRGGWASHSTIVAMGRTWGTIETLLRGELVLASQRVRVQTSTWRAATIGGRHTSKQWDALAKEHVRQRFGVVDVSDDEAEAILIGVWASYAARVGDVVRGLAA